MRLIGKGNIKHAFIPDAWMVTTPSTQIKNNDPAVYVDIFTQAINANGASVTFGLKPLVTSRRDRDWQLRPDSSAFEGRFNYLVLPNGTKVDELRVDRHMPLPEIKVRLGGCTSFRLWNSWASEDKQRETNLHRDRLTTTRDAYISNANGTLIKKEVADWYQHITTVTTIQELEEVLGFNIEDVPTGRVILKGITEYGMQRFYEQVQPIATKVRDTEILQQDNPHDADSQWRYVYYNATVSMSGLEPKTFTQPVFVYKADDDIIVSAYELEVDSENNVIYVNDLGVDEIIDLKNKELVRVAKARRNGADVKVNRTKPTIPENLSPAVKTNVNNWWNQFLQMADEVDKIPLGETSSLNDWLAANPGSTVESYKNSMRSDEKKGTSAWANLWDSLKGGTSAIWDTVTGWGPLQIAGGYAAVKGTNAITKNSPLVLAVVIGIVAVLTLKN